MILPYLCTFLALLIMNFTLLIAANDLLYHSFTDPPTFKTEPVSVKAKLNQRVRLTCSYQNFTQIKSFQWLKDGKAYDPPKLEVLEGRFPRAVSPDSTKYLYVQGSDPELQGYYTCMVKDALNNTVKSKESLVHFTGKLDLRFSVWFSFDVFVGDRCRGTCAIIAHRHRLPDLNEKTAKFLFTTDSLRLSQMRQKVKINLKFPDHRILSAAYCFSLCSMIL